MTHSSTVGSDPGGTRDPERKTDTDVSRAQMPVGAIVVAVDHSTRCRPAAIWAAQECRRRALPLHIVGVGGRGGRPSGRFGTSDPVVEQAVCDAHTDNPALLTSVSSVEGGDPTIRLTGLSRSATLLVVPQPAASPGARDRLRRVVARSHCPVTVVAAREPDPCPGPEIAHTPVVVIVEPGRLAALEEALAAASRRWTDLVVVTTNRSSSDPRVTRLIAGFPDVRTTVHQGVADPGPLALDLGTSAALLVTGSRQFLAGPPGNSLLDLWWQAPPCPVMSVPDAP